MPSAVVLPTCSTARSPTTELKTADFGQHFVNFQGARTKYFDECFRRAAEAGVRRWSFWRRDWIPRLPVVVAGRNDDLRAGPS